MKVYVIYQVSYDNETILYGVVSSKEKAKEITDESPYLEYNEFELDKP